MLGIIKMFSRGKISINKVAGRLAIYFYVSHFLCKLKRSWLNRIFVVRREYRDGIVGVTKGELAEKYFQ